MPITAYTGLPRSGKSYSVVEHVIIPAAKSGRKLYTNIPLYIDKIEKDFPDAQIHQFDMAEAAIDPEWFRSDDLNGSIIVMDELWRLWPSGTRSNQIPEAQLSLIKEHGHRTGVNGHTIELVFVTQDLADLATAARNMVETTYRTTKLDTVGQATKYRVDVYRGAKTGPEPENQKRLDQIFGSYKPNIYQYYKTQTQSIGTMHGDESKTDNRFALSYKKRLAIIGGAVLAVPFVLYFLAQTLYDYYGNPDQLQETTEQQVSGGTPPPNAPQAPKNKVPKLPDIEIVYNSGHWPLIEYQFRLFGDGAEAIVSRHDLYKMGYRTEAITNCLVVVTEPTNKRTFAMCRSNDTDQGGSILHTAANEI
jgi:zona occludens toxin